MQEQYDVTIFGSVSRPDTYPYAENMTVEDLVIAAGGLLESASTANVIVTRRVKDPRSTRVSDTLFETFTVNISDALSTDGEGGFVLKPFDQVYVRRSPVYITQSSVTVRGEVTFEGTYPLSHRNMRISVMTFIYKPKRGLAGRLFHRYVSMALDSSNVTDVIVFSRSEVKHYAKLFPKAAHKFRYMPLGIAATPDIEPRHGDYIFTAGISNRDYDF